MSAKPEVLVSTLDGNMDSIFDSKTLESKALESKAVESKRFADEIRKLGFHEYMSKNNKIVKALQEAPDSKNVGLRVGVCILMKSLADMFGRSAGPYLVPQIGSLVDMCGDKANEVRKAAEEAVDSVFKLAGDCSAGAIVPILLSVISDSSKRWRSKICALKYLSALSDSSREQVCYMLPEILPVVFASMWDTKVEVQKASKEATEKIVRTIDNIDIVPFLPSLVQSIIDPTEVPECVFKLAATTFVTEVKAPTLAIMTPLLSRGLKERKAAVLRQTAVVIENMCKLVEDHTSAHQFLPQLMPGIDRIVDSASDPELRSVAYRAKATLIRVCGGDSADIDDPETIAKKIKSENEAIKKRFKDAVNAVSAKEVNSKVVDYAGLQIALMYRTGTLDQSKWENTLLCEVQPFVDNTEKSKKVVNDLLVYYSDLYSKEQVAKTREEEEEGVEICNCEFSIAYGGMILLNNTKLRLLKGKCYILCGPNGVGKSTLMRSISNGQLEGFPPQDVLKTVFVEHNLQSEEADVPVLDFILKNADLQDNKDDVLKVLSDFGFKDEYLKYPVGALSGGWKMKLELARAMMQHADILLLDEPTNHLDVKNVAWLVDYIKNAKGITSLIVSHDSSFVDKVATHVISFENLKLKITKGNLSKFVESHPEALSYYKLESTKVSFKFPEPGFLEGVKSKDKAILKMLNVSYTYPGTSKKALNSVSVQCSLNSRVAVIGPNGAGKSTLVKLLTGELVPAEGEVWKHPNLRVAYVAQHAFHHVEMHLDKTPNEYVRWRYSNGEDKESLVKAARQLTPEEEAIIKKPIGINGEKRYLENIVGRRKVKRSYEYEIKWVKLPHDENTWHSRERLEEWGFAKMVQWFDEKEASKEGMYSRPLTSAAVQKHFEDVGLPAEFSTHNRIRGLSGGQKVKVVLGSAMWNNPHILVLDEPTNYLDADSLGALTTAIKNFGGGVVIISHNRQFTQSVNAEVWNTNNGEIEIEGGKKPTVSEKINMKENESYTDAFGNEIKVKSTRKLTRKELKQKEKRRQQKIKNGEPLSSSEEDF